MIRNYIVIALVFSTTATALSADPWQLFETQSQSSLRGLAAMNKDVAWACGSKGTVIRTVDGGQHWNSLRIPDLDAVEIRSIHVWGADQAIVATAGQPARILKTNDGGQSWNMVYQHLSPRAFIDGLRFWDNLHGIAFSDPIESGMLIVTTADGGVTWTEVASEQIPHMRKNEAGFAASNSSLIVVGDKSAWIGLGGETGFASRVFRTMDLGRHWTAHDVAPIQATASAGIFSLCFINDLSGVAVGGDFQRDAIGESNIALTDDGGTKWREPQQSRPRGYRSCVVSVLPAGFTKHVWVACGPTGCDWSKDRESWNPLSDIGFHTMFTTEDGNIWASGAQGRIGILDEATWNRLISE